MFPKTTALPFLVLAFLAAAVRGQESSDSSGHNATSPVPSSFPDAPFYDDNDEDIDNDNDQSDSDAEEGCGAGANCTYSCGDYSLALPIGRLGNKGSGGSSGKGERPVRFISADITCAFDSDRKIFDNDYISRNDIKNMVWKTNEGDPVLLWKLAGGGGNLTVSEPPNSAADVGAGADGTSQGAIVDPRQWCGEPQQDGEICEDDDIAIPKKIHVRIYAIDDDLEPRYRSHPWEMILPFYDVLPDVEFDNHSYLNSELLRFVWNQTAGKKRRRKNHPTTWEKIVEDTRGQEKDENYAALEMWIPNWMLETSIIMGPKYDYSLGIEIGGTVNSGGNGSNDNNETIAAASETNETTFEIDDPTFLLTQGPPSRLTVLNRGIGTQVTLVISPDSESSGVDPGTELRFFDESMSGEVRIKTHENVTGTIQMAGSNVRAAIVRSGADDTGENVGGGGGGGGERLRVSVTGFRQVVTADGDDTHIALGGDSNTLFTTGGCLMRDGVMTVSSSSTCEEVNVDLLRNITNGTTIANETSVSEIAAGPESSWQWTLGANLNYTNGTFPDAWRLKPLLPVVKLPKDCLVETETMKYNCNPLHSETRSEKFFSFAPLVILFIFVAVVVVIIMICL